MGVEGWFKERRERECRSKQAYETEVEAREAADSIGRRSGKELGTYRCLFCRHWHLTSSR